MYPLPNSLPLLVTVTPATVPDPFNVYVPSDGVVILFEYNLSHCFVLLPKSCVTSVLGIKSEFTDAVTVTSSVDVPPMVALPVATSAWVVVSPEGGAHIIGPPEICFGSRTSAIITSVVFVSATRPVVTVILFEDTFPPGSLIV